MALKVVRTNKVCESRTAPVTAHTPRDVLPPREKGQNTDIIRNGLTTALQTSDRERL